MGVVACDEVVAEPNPKVLLTLRACARTDAPSRSRGARSGSGGGGGGRFGLGGGLLFEEAPELERVAGGEGELAERGAKEAT
jgi:hypothetical protein